MSRNPPSGRREKIARRLDDGHAMVASDLALEFEVSEDAIRRDLRALAAEGRCRRVYGGALPLSPASGPVAARVGENRAVKRALAEKAVELVKPGELVFLDSGSTNLALIELIPRTGNVTVGTNSIAIAAAALERELQLILVGGAVTPDVGGAVDASAVQAVQKLNFDRCFLGACSLSVAEGMGAFDFQEAAFKRAVLDASREVVVLAANEKLETRSRHRVAGLGGITVLVVEHDADRAVVEAVREQGPAVMFASKPS